MRECLLRMSRTQRMPRRMAGMSHSHSCWSLMYYVAMSWLLTARKLSDIYAPYPDNIVIYNTSCIRQEGFIFISAILILNILEFLEISALQVRSKVIDTFFLLFMCIASSIADQSFVVLAPFCTSSWRPPVSSEPLAGYKLVHGAPLGNCRPSQARLRIEHNIMFQSNQGAGDGKLTIIQCR